MPIQASSCSSSSPSAVVSEPLVDSPARTSGQLNVVPQGLARFETGMQAPVQLDWEQLSPRIISVLGQNPSHFTLNGTNCYLVGTGRRRLLIDAAERFAGSAQFMDNLALCMQEHGVEGLDGIIITHMHWDHYGNIDRLQDKYGPIPVYANITELPAGGIFDKVRELGLMHLFVGSDGLPLWSPNQRGPSSQSFTDAEGREVDLSWAEDATRSFPGDSIGLKLRHLFFYSYHGHILREKLRSGALPWQPLSDGMVISTEGATLKSLHAPGHSDDHMAFLIEEEHSIFSGDHVLGWGTTLVADMRDYMSTLRRLLNFRPLRLYPGHGCFIEDGMDILVRYIDHRENRELQAWEALARRSVPVRIAEIAQELYPGTLEERLHMARDNTEKLFRKFVADGAVLAWEPITDDTGTERFVRFEVPSSYSVRRLPEDLRWSARRSMASRL